MIRTIKCVRIIHDDYRELDAVSICSVVDEDSAINGRRAEGHDIPSEQLHKISALKHF